MRRGPGWGATLALMLAAGLAGLGAATLSDTPEAAYDRAKYHLRETLGLPKRWRTLPGPGQAGARAERPCPPPGEALVLVTGGQSNAANTNPVRHAAGRDVAVWFDGRCFAAADPVLGATGRDGSLWSLLGDDLAARLDRPVVLVNGAVGGTQFGDWLDDRSGYYAALTGRVQAAAAAGFHPDLILWHQGETDAAAERDMDELRREIGALVDRLLADIPDAPLYLFQASRCIGARRVDGVPEVVAVQRQVAAARDRVVEGLNTDTLGRDARWDTCHFNSLGRQRIVETVGPDIAALLRAGGPGG